MSRKAVRKREVLARLRRVRRSVWRARLSAEKWLAITCECLFSRVPQPEFRWVLNNLFYWSELQRVNGKLFWLTSNEAGLYAFNRIVICPPHAAKYNPLEEGRKAFFNFPCDI